MAKFVLSFFAALMLGHGAFAGNEAKIVIPAFDDKYSGFVRQLEAGQTDINYTEFRNSFLESEQFKVVANQSPDLRTLRTTMRELMKSSKYPEIIDVTKKILSLDYTDMEAHKILQQTYKILGDTGNAKKYHDIEFGLLNSIVRKGDGKSCRTGWPVVQVEEEYFILGMLGANVRKQSVDNTGGVCDRIEVETPEGNATYYFEISKVFEGYKKRGLK
ncbi:MAG TPA: DUF4919 domain-containing protein [Chthoniobacterales bacterium]|nr:DUF4919 domain-containing protein [Chthoniobacterales bacterium]